MNETKFNHYDLVVANDGFSGWIAHSYGIGDQTFHTVQNDDGEMNDYLEEELTKIDSI